jgi:Carboxypeptidase regulatory-like domain
MKTLSPYFAICSLVAASTVIASAQQLTTKPATSGAMSATGTVVGPTSQPEPGIPVELTGPFGKTFAVTDQNGRWTVYNLPAGQYNVQAAGSYKASESHTSFTVKDQGVWQKWFGGVKNTIETPQIRASKQSPLKK